MAKRLDIIAQETMDDFYQSYKGEDQFFTLSDFISRCGDTATDLYLQEYRTRRAELRSEKKDEVVIFDNEWLSVEHIDVTEKDGEMSGELSTRVMSFPFDSQNVGLQDVFSIVPRGTFLERSSITEHWQYKYLPMTDRIFWRLESENGKDKIVFHKNGFGNIRKAKVMFVPAIHENAELPDAIANYVRTTTVINMKQMQNGVVIEKTNDGNPNKAMETEINKTSLKR